MIATVTLNVAIDKLYLVDEAQVGTVTRVKECSATAGGKGLNVARVASILKEEVLATGFIGGHSGRFVEEMLKNDGIPSDFIHVDGESRTCINIIDQHGKSTEFLEPGVIVTKRDIDQFIAKFTQIVKESNVVVLSGSLPRGCDTKFYADLIRLAKEGNCKVILDTSGENLKRGIEASPTMIKPNKDEIRTLLGIDASSRDSVIKAAETIHHGGIPYVVVSLGKIGAVLACDDGIFAGNPPSVNAINTVGCGDSMVSAFAVGFERGYPVEKTFQFALAVSAANAMCKQTGFFCPDDLKNILPDGKVIKLA